MRHLLDLSLSLSVLVICGVAFVQANVKALVLTAEGIEAHEINFNAEVPVEVLLALVAAAPEVLSYASEPNELLAA